MAYPAISDFASFILILAVGIPLIILFAKALKLQPQKPNINGKKKTARKSKQSYQSLFLF
jgi:hypothetical protein